MRICRSIPALLAIGLVACGSPSEPSVPVEAVAPPDQQSTPQTVESEGLNEYERMEQAALSGDYQAQRNIAYTLATGIPHNPVLACAWRIVIVESGSLQVDQSDIGNKAADCDRKLDADGLAAAQAQAKTLKEQIVSRASNAAPVAVGS